MFLLRRHPLKELTFLRESAIGVLVRDHLVQSESWHRHPKASDWESSHTPVGSFLIPMPWTITRSGADGGFRNDFSAVVFLTCPSPLMQRCQMNPRKPCVREWKSRSKTIAGHVTRKWTRLAFRSKCTTMQDSSVHQNLNDQ